MDKIEFMPADYGAKENSSEIKVIGVGGAGSNAVQHMYAEGIQGVDYLVCNTDKCHLNACKIQDKLLLGNGLGAGSIPDVARELAAKSEDKIKEFIGENTKMLFIAAGMGKGTGTGASPVVAKVAKDMGILTVGVVTEPFRIEGKRRREAAEQGIDEMSKYVDSLIVVNNQNLMKYYSAMEIDEAYAQVDDVLKNAVKCIAEIITVTYGQNVDFNDVKTIMQNSGKAMLGIATAEGDDRVQKVLDDVLNCPLLDNADISDAKNLLFFVTYGPSKKITMGELEVLQDRFDELQSDNVNLIWGHGLDESLGESIKLSLVVTNFNSAQQGEKETEIVINDTDQTIVTTEDGTMTTNVTEEQLGKMQTETEKAVETETFPVDEETNSIFEPQEPVWQNTPSTTFTFAPDPQPHLAGNYNNDEDFNNMVNTPTIVRDRMNTVQSQSRVMVEEEPVSAVYYELKDDVNDVFHGFAD
ncbi:MAG: cell division protein FtsZ [Bacteroidales bacterium]|nr:cell division protein FtsZ [Bacteroidales bacterium]